jgi:hypothetical protein
LNPTFPEMADQEEEEPKFYMKGYKVEENQEERPV